MDQPWKVERFVFVVEYVEFPDGQRNLSRWHPCTVTTHKNKEQATKAGNKWVTGANWRKAVITGPKGERTQID